MPWGGYNLSPFYVHCSICFVTQFPLVLWIRLIHIHRLSLVFTFTVLNRTTASTTFRSFHLISFIVSESHVTLILASILCFWWAATFTISHSALWQAAPSLSAVPLCDQWISYPQWRQCCRHCPWHKTWWVFWQHPPCLCLSDAPSGCVWWTGIVILYRNKKQTPKRCFLQVALKRTFCNG